MEGNYCRYWRTWECACVCVRSSREPVVLLCTEKWISGSFEVSGGIHRNPAVVSCGD